MTVKDAAKDAPEVSGALRAGLVVVALAAMALSIFQWIELWIVREGGHAICGINAHVNCETVWNSAFAARIHGLVKVPVAGLGLTWALVAVFLTWVLLVRLRNKAPIRKQVLALRITSAIGVLSCITFGVASARIGALCLTCLTTYVLVIVFAVLTFRLPGALAPAEGELGSALSWAVLPACAAYLLVLWPGLVTPTQNDAMLAVVRASQASGKTSATAPSRPDELVRPAAAEPIAEGNSQVAQFLERLPPQQLQAVSDALAMWKSSTPQDQSYPIRERWGPADAPVKMVDFTDIKCPHCKHLVDEMAELRKHLPPGSLSVESRFFPLDSECNPNIPAQYTDHTGVRCAGAKAQICLEKQPDFLKLQRELFDQQNSLKSPEDVVRIASSGSLSKDALGSCMKSPKTAQALQQDLDYAMLYHCNGTPLVLINGHSTWPVPAFIYAMALAHGNGNDAAFSRLPPPDPLPTE